MADERKSPTAARTRRKRPVASGAEDTAITAIAVGDHGDPFAVLGMHQNETGLVVRAFLPEAEAVSVVDAGTGRKAAEMERVHPNGVFQATISRRKQPFPYRFRMEAAGEVHEIEDPYRFPLILGELDLHLIATGNHFRIYEKLGAHPMTVDGVEGVSFAVWAPNARRVSVVGGFNAWDGRRHPMRLRREAGVWELFIPGLGPGTIYKYEIKGPDGAIQPLKADPYGARYEHPPSTATIVHGLNHHAWQDEAWMAGRERRNAREAPIAVYECHLGSWMRIPEEGHRYLTYDELADRLIPYVKKMGFTHIELLPITEFPFDGSWGYQPIGLFAPTSRHGGPEDFAAFVDRCHAEDIGLILDWVPGHFPTDAHGLGYFDGTHLYEHADPRQGFHLDWNTLIFNYGRREVTNYLLGSALFWCDQYHADGLRVDAVASMLYLDYSRSADAWVPNIYGGNENLEAISFLKQMNELVYERHPGATTTAEESTSWPAVSRPTYLGGLGFGYKWNMGWMHDTLQYIAHDPIHRRYHHHALSFGLLYAFSENFVLPLSHDEVVHGKGSLLGKMPGDRWQKFANLRAYFGFMWTHPGKKLLFMGGEIAQEREWNHDASLDWHLLDDPHHQGVQRLIRDLNALYRRYPALHALDCEPEGFEWIEANDADHSVLAFLRKDRDGERPIVSVNNFTPEIRRGYRVGVPGPGFYAELLNTDAGEYGGSNVGNAGGVVAEAVPWHGRPYSIRLTIPPLATLILERRPA